MNKYEKSNLIVISNEIINLYPDVDIKTLNKLRLIIKRLDYEIDR